MSTASVRVAAAQVRADAEPLPQIDAAIAEAARDGADLVVLPELATTGYAVTPQSVREWFASGGHDRAQERMRAHAREHEVAIVYGHLIKDADGTFGNAASLLDPTGQALATYRKTHLFPGVDTECFIAGDEISPVVEWRGVRIGMAICYDVEFPELVRALALAGAQLVCAPTANMLQFDTVSQLLVPARAHENGISIAYANYCGRDARYEYGGLSVVAGPDGRSRTTAGRDEPGIITATVRAHPRSDYLRDRRPDVSAHEPRIP